MTTSYRHSLADVIACSWWPSDRAKDLLPPVAPYVFDEEQPLLIPATARGEPRAWEREEQQAYRNKKREEQSGRRRVALLDLLEKAPKGELTTQQVALALEISLVAASNRLKDLARAGLAHYVVRRGPRLENVWMPTTVLQAIERAA